MSENLDFKNYKVIDTGKSEGKLLSSALHPVFPGVWRLYRGSPKTGLSDWPVIGFFSTVHVQAHVKTVRFHSPGGYYMGVSNVMKRLSGNWQSHLDSYRIQKEIIIP